MIRRILAMLNARNLEFLRDRSALSWNLILPFLLVFGFASIFSDEEKVAFNVAVKVDNISNDTQLDAQLNPFLGIRYINFFSVQNIESVIPKVGRHQVDMLLDLRPDQMHYWINSDSSNGYFLQKLLTQNSKNKLTKQTVEGTQVRYIDWVVPGILGMNIMFSCLFGVGFVIVRYRKNGYLKRLKATPLRAIEFIISQILSRLFLIIIITCILFIGTDFFMNFTMKGSYLDLFIILIIGTSSMISLGLLVATRVSSEELAGGLLNLISWPMLIVSGVWFPIEGSRPILSFIAELSPLTHLLSASRGIMLDGLGLMELKYQLSILTLMTVVFMLLGARLFKWTPE